MRPMVSMSELKRLSRCFAFQKRVYRIRVASLVDSKQESCGVHAGNAVQVDVDAFRGWWGFDVANLVT